MLFVHKRPGSRELFARHEVRATTAIDAISGTDIHLWMKRGVLRIRRVALCAVGEPDGSIGRSWCRIRYARSLFCDKGKTAAAQGARFA